MPDKASILMIRGHDTGTLAVLLAPGTRPCWPISAGPRLRVAGRTDLHQVLRRLPQRRGARGGVLARELPSLLKGSQRGAVIRPGDAAASRMIRQLTGLAKPAMPPKGEPRPHAEEIALLKAWIDSGARGPQAGEPADRLALVVPRIASQAKVRPVTALDASRDGRWLAIARDASVALHRTTGGGGGRTTRRCACSRTFPARSRPYTSAATVRCW